MKTVVSACSALGAAALLMLPDVAFACEKCFGAAGDSPTTRGISLAMLALIGMTGIVWSGIGLFFVNMRKRAKLLEPGDLMVTEQGDILTRPHDNP